MQAKRWAAVFRVVLASSVVVGCKTPSAAPIRGMKGSDLASQYCALAKPCATGARLTTCESAVTAALPAIIDESASKISLDALRAAQAAPPSCVDSPELVAVAKAVPLDMPKLDSGTERLSVLSVSLAADGTTSIGDKPVPSDEAILAAARDARAKNPELRAVIKADSTVPHGRVIHVLDLLKQAQVSKIAFGVTPAPVKTP